MTAPAICQTPGDVEIIKTSPTPALGNKGPAEALSALGAVEEKAKPGVLVVLEWPAGKRGTS